MKIIEKISLAELDPGLKELLYARELFVRQITEHDAFDSWLEDYFMQFAVAARHGR